MKRQSKLISGRNPLAEDEELINYDMDSEEELMLEDAESIKSQDDEEEDDFDDEEEAGFVVSDGHLSDEELEDLDEEERRIIHQN
jgi:chromatin assembly factor 1 subunit A